MLTKTQIAIMLGTLFTLGVGVWNTAHGAEEMKPIAVCNDGKTMYGPDPSRHIGACRGHQGVKSWADGSPVRSKAAKKTEYK